MADNNLAQTLIRDKFLINFNNLVAWPARTGIQRVCYEFCSRWPYIADTLPFVELGMDRIGILDPAFFESVRQLFEESDDVLKAFLHEFPDLDIDTSPGMIGLRSARNRIILEISVADSLEYCRGVLSLEESLNLEFFSVAAATRPEKIFNLCHDFLSWTHSEYFSTDWKFADNVSISASNRRKYSNNFFTSTATRDVFVNRINRGDKRHYAVIPAGADGLGRMFRKSIPSSREFLVVGTLEPRKQPIRILRAFEALQAAGHDARLCFAGRLGWLDVADKAKLTTAFKTYSWLRWVDGPDDEELRDLVMNCRATVYLSVAEGFGSPPVESLALGVPCIVSANLPSVLDMASGGQIRIAPDDDEALADAVRRLLDDGAIVDLQLEIETQELPTWQAFVDGIVGLVEEKAPARREAAGQPSCRASLDILGVLSLMWQLERRELVERLVLAVQPDATERELTRWQITAERSAWSNVDVVLNVMQPLGLPAGLVGDAVAGRLDAPLMPTEFAKEWRARFRALMRISPFPDFIAAIYTELHGRLPGDDELEASLPPDEVAYTRIAYLRSAVNSDEYRERLVREVRQKCPEDYLEKVLPVEIGWQDRILDQLVMEAAVDRALLIEKDENFIVTASLDLAGQPPSRDVQATLGGLLRGRFGRERVLLRLLMSEACLRRVCDPSEHLQLIHRLAARAGLADPVPASVLQIAARANAVLALPPHRRAVEAFAVFFGRKASLAESALAHSGHDTDDAHALVARLVIYGTLRGDIAFSSRFVSWATGIVVQTRTPGKDATTKDEDLASFEQLFEACQGRPPHSQEIAVLAQAGEDGLSDRAISEVIRVVAIRQNATVDLSAEVRHFAQHAAAFIAQFDQITAQADRLQAVAPKPAIKPWIRPRPVAAPEIPRAIDVPQPVFREEGFGDPITVDQLMAADGTDFIGMVYRKLLLREPDASGLQSYTTAMNNGLSKTSVIYSIATSPEGKATKANLIGLEALLMREQKLRRWPVRKLMKIAGIRL